MKFVSVVSGALLLVGWAFADIAATADNVKISISNVEGSFLFGAVAERNRQGHSIFRGGRFFTRQRGAEGTQDQGTID